MAGPAVRRAGTRAEAVVAHGFLMDVPAPIEFYDAPHAEIGRLVGGGVPGALVHGGRATRNGFRVIEIWETKEQCDRFKAEGVGPASAELTGGRPPAGPVVEEFEPRGLL